MDSLKNLSLRDRALAELARARGWVDDAALEGALSVRPLDLGSSLVAKRLLTDEQLRSLREAVDGEAEAAAEAKIGPYILMNELGRGGMGVVYRAMNPEFRREVALKVLRAGEAAGDDDIERFRREAAMLARLRRHPALIPIHDVGRDGDRLYFTMELIAGRSLRARVAAEGPLPPRDAAALVASVAAALAVIHEAGIVHRDIKPHNILLDRSGAPFLGDFGLARDTAAAAGLTASGDVFGTPAYMAPEQAAGGARAATPASDIYSLGATLFESLTGRPPFEAENIQALLQQVLKDDAPAPRAFRPDLPSDLDTICQKAMRRDPARRYASASAFEADLRRFLSGEAIAARPPRMGERFARSFRRHTGPWIAGAAVVALTLVVGGWGGWKWYENERVGREQAEDLKRRTAKAAPLVQRGVHLLELAAESEAQGDLGAREPQVREAAEALAAAAAIMPEDAEVRYQLARALRKSGRESEALATLAVAVHLNPKHALAWFERGSIAQEMLFRMRAQGRLRSQQESAAGQIFWRLQLPVRTEATGPVMSEEALLASATADFRNVLATGAAPEQAAYGSAMLEYLHDRPAEAIALLDKVLEKHPSFPEALRAAADIREWQWDGDGAIPFRLKLLHFQPNNPEVKLTGAIALATLGLGHKNAGRFEQAQPLLEKARSEFDSALARAGDDYRTLLLAVNAAMALNDTAAALPIARRLQAAARNPAERRNAAVAVIAVLSALQPGDALAEVEAQKALFSEEDLTAVRFSLLSRSRREPAALRLWRALPRGTEIWHSRMMAGAAAELYAGNLHTALDLATEAGRRSEWGARALAGHIRLEMGDLDGAHADLTFRDRTNHPTIGGQFDIAIVTFLQKKYPESIAALRTAPGDGAANPQALRQYQQIVDNVAAPLLKNPSRETALQAIERLFAFTLLALNTDPGRREFLEGNWAALARLLAFMQDFYLQEKEYEKALVAGKRLMDLHPTALACLRDARVKVAAGMKEEALVAIEKAAEMGFDEGRALDEMRGLDGIREEARFRAVRSKCR